MENQNRIASNSRFMGALMSPPLRLLPTRRLPLLPLLVLLALAVALAALPSADSVHAQGQTTVWSATLTVDKVDEYHGCDNEDTSQDNCSTNLTDDEFTYGGVTYTVEGLYYDSNEESLWLRFVLPVTALQAKAALGPLTLHVDGIAFAVSDSEVNEPDLVWSFDPDPEWADEQKVSLSLTIPGPPGNLHLVDLKTEAGHQKVTLTWDAASEAEKPKITGYEVQQGTSVSAMTASAWSSISGSDSRRHDSYGHGPDQRHDLLLQHPGDGPGRRRSGFTLGVGNAGAQR